MRAAVLTRVGELDGIEICELPRPEPRAREVRVRVQAAALNHRDLWIARGAYAKIRVPAVLGSDGAGVVDAVGADVDAALVGREVVICPSLGWGADPRAQNPAEFRVLGMPDPGTFAEWICVPAENVAAKPTHLSWSQAAALPLAGLTSWRAVVTQAQVQRGERVLVTGIGGGVAAIAAQLATALGAEVWATSGDEGKLETARRLGVRGGVSYRLADWPRMLTALAGGEMNAVIDGTAGATFPQLLQTLGYAGRLVIYGATLGDPEARWDVRRVFWRQIRILGSTMGTPAEFTTMLEFVASHRLVPAVDRVFPLSEVRAALARLAAGAQMGKIVLQVGG